MDLTLDIEVKSTLRTDLGRTLLSYRPLVLSDSGVKGDIVVSENDRPLAVDQRIKVTCEGKSCWPDTECGIGRLITWRALQETQYHRHMWTAILIIPHANYTEGKGSCIGCLECSFKPD